MYKMLGFLLFMVSGVAAQPVTYTTANAHSHNDYEQKIPFWMAYNEGFGSIEADIFLEEGNLLVSHDRAGLKKNRSLKALYLQPLQSSLEKNKGYAFSDTSRSLQMLIDIKTSAIPTLERLVEELKHYPALINNPSIKWVISGNRPADSLYHSYPSFIQFDGILSKEYQEEALTRIVLMSDNFRNYSSWDGKGRIPSVDLQKLKAVIKKAHALNKPVRFWNAPDDRNAWKELMELQVDFINTDHIQRISEFYKSGAQKM